MLCKQRTHQATSTGSTGSNDGTTAEVTFKWAHRQRNPVALSSDTLFRWAIAYPFGACNTKSFSRQVREDVLLCRDSVCHKKRLVLCPLQDCQTRTSFLCSDFPQRAVLVGNSAKLHRFRKTIFFTHTCKSTSQDTLFLWRVECVR